jgi:hypothetical protein
LKRAPSGGSKPLAVWIVSVPASAAVPDVASRSYSDPTVSPAMSILRRPSNDCA